MTAPCSNCGVPIETRRRVAPGTRIACSSIGCIKAVTAAHNAAVAQYQAENPPIRRPRQPRRPQPLYGDLRWMAAINGISSDGTGRKNR